MKRAFIILLMCMFLISFVSAYEINYTDSSSSIDTGISLTQLKYEPYPVNPGEYFDIWIKANTGSSSINTIFELVPKFPFSLDENEDPIRTFGSTSTEVVMKYKVRVSKDAVEGINPLDLRYSINKNNDYWISKSFDIQVADAQTDFDLIIQESSGTDVSLALANIGKNTANSLIVRIPEQDSFRVSGTNGQMVGNLNSGDYTIVSFGLTPVGRSTGMLKVQLDYTDSIGERRSVIKEVQFISNSPIGNITGRYGNFSRGNTQRSSSTQQTSSSIFKSIWFWLIIALGGYYFYRNPEKVKKILSKLNKDKSEVKKDLKGIPEWVSTERKKRK